VQTGGPSGGCIPPEMFDTPVDYESLAQLGSIMGSGGMVVMDEDNCMVDVARYFVEFTHSESCGKCIPCRVGLNKCLRILNRVTEGAGTMHHLELLDELSRYIRDCSLCGLGQTAPNPVLTTCGTSARSSRTTLSRGAAKPASARSWRCPRAKTVVRCT
jgi:NADH-quinone oxidoreductase subunit F